MGKSLKSYLAWILISEGVGLLAAYLSRDGVEFFRLNAVQPQFSPPGFVFPAVWTALYLLMGISAARIFMTPPDAYREAGLNLFVGQLIFQFFWTLIFFNGKNYGLAFFWIVILWVLVFLMILTFRKVDRTAALLQIPYLLWITFAAVLNKAVWRLN